jgi:hypothetical protein
MTDAEHWLFRLDAGAWLRAARHELDGCAANIASRRAAVTHARRAAGMAINAVLVGLPDGETRWGRSYLEHLQALARVDAAGLAPLDAEVQAAAGRLLATAPVAPPTGLVALGRGPHAAADEALAAAIVVVEACAAAVAEPG